MRASRGTSVWVRARHESDYASFRTALERNLELRRRYIACFDDFDDPYDILLDDYEPDMKTADAAAVLGRLREELVPLVAVAREAGDVDGSFLDGPFPIDAQQRVERTLLDAIGFEPEHWRLDVAVHPMAFSFGTGDIRISTRYSETSLESVFSALHEFGHGLYERQVDPASPGRRSAAACRSASTSRRAGSGRTSSGAGCRSGGGSIRCSRRSSRSGSVTWSSSSSTAP